MQMHDDRLVSDCHHLDDRHTDTQHPLYVPGLRTCVSCVMQNPVSYTVYGVVASQLGTVDNEFVIQVGHGNTWAGSAEQLSPLHIPLLLLRSCRQCWGVLRRVTAHECL
jgi:hypothetical protein